MSYEEFYKTDFKDGEQKESYYITTLLLWLIYNKFDVFEEVLEHFEARENYLVCAGIHLALEKVEDLMHNRFEEATPIEEDGDHKTYTFEEYENVSKQVLRDIIIELYERQAKKFKSNH